MEDIAHQFKKTGANVTSVDLIRNADGLFRCFAYINIDTLLASSDAMKGILQMHNTLWRGCKLRVEVAKPTYIERLRTEWAKPAAVADVPACPPAAAPPTAGSPDSSINTVSAVDVLVTSGRLLRIRKKTGEHRHVLASHLFEC